MLSSGRLALACLVAGAQGAWVAAPAVPRGAAAPRRCGGGAAVLSMPPSSGLDGPPPRPGRRPQMPAGPKAGSDDGFVFGASSVTAAARALASGGLVLLTEDGEAGTAGALYASPRLVSTEQLKFMLDHAWRLQVTLEPERYRAVYSSLRQIVLDNKCLDFPGARPS